MADKEIHDRWWDGESYEELAVAYEITVYEAHARVSRYFKANWRTIKDDIHL